MVLLSGISVDEITYIVESFRKYLRYRDIFNSGKSSGDLIVLPNNDEKLKTKIPVTYATMVSELVELNTIIKNRIGYIASQDFDSEMRKSIFNNLTNFLQTILQYSGLNLDVTQQYEMNLKSNDLLQIALTNDGIANSSYLALESSVLPEQPTIEDADDVNSKNKMVKIQSEIVEIPYDDTRFMLYGGRSVYVYKLRAICTKGDDYDIDTDVIINNPMNDTYPTSIASNVAGFNLSSVVANALMIGVLSDLDYNRFRTIIYYINLPIDDPTNRQFLFKDTEFGTFFRQNQDNKTVISQERLELYNEIYRSWTYSRNLNSIEGKSVSEALFHQLINKLNMFDYSLISSNNIGSPTQINFTTYDEYIHYNDIRLFCGSLELQSLFGEKSKTLTILRSILSNLMFTLAYDNVTIDDANHLGYRTYFKLFPIRDISKVFGSRFSYQVCCFLLLLVNIVAARD